MKANKYNNNPDDVDLHTSAFAAADERSSGNSVRGRVKSFEDRLVSPGNGQRSVVGGYRQSMLGRSHVVRERAKTFERARPAVQGAEAPPPITLQARNSGNVSEQSVSPAQPRRQQPFREPPPRNFNPLG